MPTRRRAKDGDEEESGEDTEDDGTGSSGGSSSSSSGSFEEHGRVFEALEALDSALGKPGYVQWRVGRLFRKYAVRDSEGLRSMSLESTRAMTKVLAVKLKLPEWLFQDIDHLYERFDFDGRGALTKTQVQKLFRTGLKQRRVELGGQKREVDVPTRSLDDAGYTVVRELGRGGQGVMYLCRREEEERSKRSTKNIGWLSSCYAAPTSGQNYCVKFYDKENANASDMDELIAEYALMKDMKSRYVAKTFEVFQDRSYYYLVNEPYFGGDLTKLAKRAHEKHITMSEGWWRGIFRQCLQGLAYLHSMAIIHCDIKEPNIMIAANDSFAEPVPVLIDFGLSTPFGRLDKDHDVNEGVGSPSGTPGYIPPETWETEVWYPSGDVFSMGVVFFQMMIARIPSDHSDIEGVLQEGDDEKALYEDAKSRRLPWDKFPANMPQLRDLIEGMTSRQRTQRLRSPQALGHDWFSSDTDALLPAKTIRDLVYHSAGHETREGVVVQLVVMNNLESLRSLCHDVEELCSAKGTVDAPAVATLLVEEAGLDEQLCKDFLKTCQASNGHQYLVQTLQEAAETQRRYNEQLIKDLFDELDTDGSGALTQRELERLLDGDAFQCPYDDIDELMEEMDTDHDGQVSWGEFLKVTLQDGRIARRPTVRMGYAKPPRCTVM